MNKKEIINILYNRIGDNIYIQKHKVNHLTEEITLFSKSDYLTIGKNINNHEDVDYLKAIVSQPKDINAYILKNNISEYLGNVVHYIYRDKYINHPIKDLELLINEVIT